ncbi:MAG: DUF4249 domain-containing protein [Chitinophagaceae bacterium]|nr:DUF4249 domain-containing protein [Chitinophagaceae bacterium]
MKTRYLLAIGCCLCFLACEKVIDLVPQSQEPKIVVDGSIETGQPPVVFATKSLDFFKTLTPDLLSTIFARNARITVNDGAQTVTLREYAIPSGIAGRFVFVYSTDTSLPAAQMTGVAGRRYTLSINFEGENYTAVTTIPLPEKKFDSLWWQPAPRNPDTNRVNVFARIADPPGLGNYIRYFTSRNDSAFLPGINSVFDDNIVDGITYNIQVFRGQSRNAELDVNEFGFFRRGDRVKVKLTNIDKATYDFWRTWEQNQQNTGNPFGVPIKVLSNISNNALGIWAGYAAQVDSLVIPR